MLSHVTNSLLVAGALCISGLGAAAEGIQSDATALKAETVRAMAGGCSGPCHIQTKGNAGNAHRNGTGVGVANSALLSIVVSDQDGHPVTGLGDSAGNGTAPIALPAGWSLFSNLNVPPGGCLLTPTEFYNWHNGAYNIRVVPAAGNPACKWLAGEYHYVVQLKDGSGQVVGSGLGAFRIQ